MADKENDREMIRWMVQRAISLDAFGNMADTSLEYQGGEGKTGLMPKLRINFNERSNLSWPEALFT